MKSRRKISDAEKRPGEDKVVLGDREFNRNVTEKMGADGVMETHVGFEPTKKSGFRKAGAGKGDRPRTAPTKQFCDNYDKIDWSK